MPEQASPDTLRQLFRHDPDTGVTYWRERPLEFCHDDSRRRRFNTRYAGTEAGASDRQGYLLVHVLGRTEKLHRVVFAMHHGRWPAGCIDHINHDKADNRIENLREVTRQENNKNLPPRSAHTGVHWMRKRERWRAVICVAGKQKDLGVFRSFEEAAAVRRAAEIEHGFHPNHGTWVGVDATTLRDEALAA